MKRTLSLKRETLTELTADDLTNVVGGTLATVVCKAWDKVSLAINCHSWKCTQ